MIITSTIVTPCIHSVKISSLMYQEVLCLQKCYGLQSEHITITILQVLRILLCGAIGAQWITNLLEILTGTT